MAPVMSEVEERETLCTLLKKEFLRRNTSLSETMISDVSKRISESIDLKKPELWHKGISDIVLLVLAQMKEMKETAGNVMEK